MSCTTKLRPVIPSLKHLHFTSTRPYDQGSLIQSYITDIHLKSKLDKNLPRPSQIILSFEFQSVYTGGRREKLKTHDYFNHSGIKFVQTSRGGEITYHGPGQLVVYPILDLTICKLKSKCYIDMLQNTIKKTLKRYGVSTVDSANTGVWVNAETKISSIGVNIQRSITSHGISINIDPDLKFFNNDELIICGLPGTKQTSIKEQVAACPSVEELSKKFVTDFTKSLGVQDVEYYKIDQDFNMSNITDLQKYL